jgi:Domain of unknown function (DUF4365)
VTQNPEEHVIARQAADAVRSLISDAGHVPEDVTHDYGEDLLVQTSHRGQMDASRMWFQVKGTAKLDRYRAKGGFRLPISVDHAVRWVRSLDLVVVALWDVVEKVGWYAIPRDQVDLYGSVTSEQKEITLHFDEADLLSVESVDRLAWRSRLEHYRMLLLAAGDAELHLERTQGIKSDERVLTALDFTDLVEVTERRVDEEGIRFRVQAGAWDAFAEIVQAKDLSTLNEKEGFQHVIDSACEAVRRRWRAIHPEVPMPAFLAEEAAIALLDQLEREAGIREKMETSAAEEAAETADSWWPGKGENG